MAADSGESRTLNSWKEIADYLGVSIRTAQKYETESGLPVRRLPGTKGRVTADTAALDEWKARVLGKPPWYSSLGFLRYYSGALTAILLLAGGILLGVYLSREEVGPPEKHRLDGNTLTVLDARDRVVFHHTFEEPILVRNYDEDSVTSRSQKKLRFQKLGSSDDICTLFAYIPVSYDTTGTQLYCFSQSGAPKWTFPPGREVSDRKGKYSPVYTIADVHVSPLEAGGRPHVLVTSHHHSSQPNQFAVLDEDGKPLREYWHCGQLYLMETIDLDRDGAIEVLLAGVNNGYGSAILLVLDPRNCSGALAQALNDPLALQGFKPGNEKAALLFPRTCVNSLKMPYNAVGRLAVRDGAIEVDTSEFTGTFSINVTYILDWSLAFRSVAVSDAFKALHRELRQRGELDHDFTGDEDKALGSNLRWLKRWVPTANRSSTAAATFAAQSGNGARR